MTLASESALVFNNLEANLEVNGAIQITLSDVIDVIRYNQRVVLYPCGFAAVIKRPRSVPQPDEWKLPYQDVELITKDKVKLRCSLIRRTEPDKSRGTIVMFHGNAMDHGEALYITGKNLFDRNFNVFSVEYRGYGNSEGIPSEKGLCLDAQAAVDYISVDPVLGKLPIIIYGRSLGGAVAIHATSQNVEKITALIVENTFTSIPDVVRTWRFVGWMLWIFCTQKWYSASKIARLPPTLPILMLSGLNDQVIPPENMKKLWEVASSRGRPSKKKVKHSSKSVEHDDAIPSKDVFESFPNGNHNSTVQQAGYWETLHAFLDSVLVSESDGPSQPS